MELNVIRRVIREVLEDFASDNVIYAEIRATPKFGPDYHKQQYIIALIEEMIKNQPLIASKLILTIDRAKGLEDAMETL